MKNNRHDGRPASTATSILVNGWPGRVLGACVLATVVLIGCRAETLLYTRNFTAFGTRVDLSLVGVSSAQAEQAMRLIERDLRFLEHNWRGSESGPLRRVNRLLAEGRPFAAAPSVLPLLELSRSFAERTDELFNPTIGRLLTLWGFDAEIPDYHPPPNASDIARLVAADPRIEDIDIEGFVLQSRNPAVQLDFTALAKGYGIDLAIAHLRELGIQHALVNIGGNVRAIGDRSGRSWRIPIRRASGGGVLATIGVRGDESVFSTSRYRRYFVYDGETYHPIIDPRTGYPASETNAVTVVHSDAATADAAAHALFIAGPSQWHRIALQMGLRYVLLIDREGRVHMNPAMAERVSFIDTGVEIDIGPPLQPIDTAPPGR